MKTIVSSIIVALLVSLPAVGGETRVIGYDQAALSARLERFLPVLETAEYVKRGQGLPTLLQAAIASLPSDHRVSRDDVIFISDLPGFSRAWAENEIREVLAEYCDPAKRNPIHSQCESRISRRAEEMLVLFRLNSGVSLGNGMSIGHRFPIFILGESVTVTRWIEQHQAGNPAPARLVRAMLAHERLHATGEVKESPCYNLELRLLRDDERDGMISGQEQYIRSLESLQKKALKVEGMLVSSAR